MDKILKKSYVTKKHSEQEIAAMSRPNGVVHSAHCSVHTALCTLHSAHCTVPALPHRRASAVSRNGAPVAGWEGSAQDGRWKTAHRMAGDTCTPAAAVDLGAELSVELGISYRGDYGRFRRGRKTSVNGSTAACAAAGA